MNTKQAFTVNNETKVFVSGKHNFDLYYRLLSEFPNGKHIKELRIGDILHTSICAPSGVLFSITYYVEHYQPEFNIVNLTEGPYGPTMYNLVK